MINQSPPAPDTKPDPPSGNGWDTGSHEEFLQYYAQQSLSPSTMARFRAARDTLLRVYGGEAPPGGLNVLDVGCGAGAQAMLWTEHGHRYHGLDINEPLIQLARQRAAEQSLTARFDVGTATALPCESASVDICLLPELLEHVADWRGCVDEAIRVMRPGGLLYINTSSRLCPRQEEFNLPCYSWYPASLKRYFEKRAITDWPAVANYAKYPAVNWFSFYQLRRYLEPQGFDCSDRFDLVDTSSKSAPAKAVLALLRYVPGLRLVGHLATPYTLVVARRR
jgi:ubiquinone/menaquinone biosynthesis C-methylase UbiE